MKKYLISFILITILLSTIFFIPVKRAEAISFGLEVPVADKMIRSKETGIEGWAGLLGALKSLSSWDAVAWAAINLVIEHLADATIDWINSGFEGSPFFVTNPGDFLKDAGDQASGVFFNQMGLDFLCAPFRARIELALRLQQNYGYRQRMQCTISEVIENYEDFINDFKAGGWAGWIAITQPQNNIYGAYLESADELERRREEARQQAQKDVDQGQGFMSWKKCVDLTTYKTKYDRCVNVEKVSKKQCEKWYCNRWEVTTPGKAINDRLGHALGVDFGRLEVADELNEIFSALFSQLMHRGLRAIGSIGRGNDGGDEEPPSISEITSALNEINVYIENEQGFVESKQNSLNTIDELITTLNALKDCYEAATIPNTVRIGEIEGDITNLENRKEGIQADIDASDSLITEVQGYIVRIRNAASSQELTNILNEFERDMQPKMHTSAETQAAADEYEALLGDLETIRAEYDECIAGTTSP